MITESLSNIPSYQKVVERVKNDVQHCILPLISTSLAGQPAGYMYLPVNLSKYINPFGFKLKSVLTYLELLHCYEEVMKFHLSFLKSVSHVLSVSFTVVIIL